MSSAAVGTVIALHHPFLTLKTSKSRDLDSAESPVELRLISEGPMLVFLPLSLSPSVPLSFSVSLALSLYLSLLHFLPLCLYCFPHLSTLLTHLWRALLFFSLFFFLLRCRVSFFSLYSSLTFSPSLLLTLLTFPILSLTCLLYM